MSEAFRSAKCLYEQLVGEVHLRVPKTPTYTLNLDTTVADRAILDKLVTEICEIYLAVSDEEREKLRRLFEDAETIWYLHLYAAHSGKLLARSPDPQIYRSALAALSIADQNPDYRDWLYAVGYLVKHARDGGLVDPLNIAKEIGAISSTAGIESTGYLLKNFERTAVHKELL